MNGGIKFRIEANDTRLITHLEQLPASLRRNLHQRIESLTKTLLAQVKAREPRRTGRLRGLTRSYVDERANFVRGRVRVLGPGRHNIAAAALEYGAHRSFTVRRSTRAGAYERRANIRARRFLRGPAAAFLPRARVELERAINQALAEVNR